MTHASKQISNTRRAQIVTAVIITVILAYTMVSLLTGHLTLVSRVCTMLLPVWLPAELCLLCALL